MYLSLTSSFVMLGRFILLCVVFIFYASLVVAVTVPWFLAWLFVRLSFNCVCIVCCFCLYIARLLSYWSFCCADCKPVYKQKQQTIQTKREMQHRKKQESKRKTTIQEWDRRHTRNNSKTSTYSNRITTYRQAKDKQEKQNTNRKQPKMIATNGILAHDKRQSRHK